MIPAFSEVLRVPGIKTQRSRPECDAVAQLSHLVLSPPSLLAAQDVVQKAGVCVQDAMPAEWKH